MEAGSLMSFSAVRMGRLTNPLPQLGQDPTIMASPHDGQTAHSNEQMQALAASGGKSLFWDEGRGSPLQELVT
jgi:hypothetical protein